MGSYVPFPEEERMRKILHPCLLMWACLFVGACVDPVLTHSPCEYEGLLWIQPFGNVDHGGGNAFFHNGLDFGNPGGAFYASAAGNIIEVDLDTGVGYPGTNYRIRIQLNPSAILDYHFEIGGDASLAERESSVLVGQGEQVTAGRHIANLISKDDNVAHVHWGVNVFGSTETCPLDYFTDAAATALETLYDSGIEKRPANRPDLCE
jgi:hypothetical protein